MELELITITLAFKRCPTAPIENDRSFSIIFSALHCFPHILGRGNLMLRHSVPHFPPNIRHVEWRNSTLPFLCYGSEEIKIWINNIFFPRLRNEPIAPTVTRLCHCEMTVLYFSHNFKFTFKSKTYFLRIIHKASILVSLFIYLPFHLLEEKHFTEQIFYFEHFSAT